MIAATWKQVKDSIYLAGFFRLIFCLYILLVYEKIYNLSYFTDIEYWRFPINDFFWVFNSTTVICAQIILIICIVLFALGYRTFVTGILSGLLSLFILCCDMKYRLPFNFLPIFGFLSLALASKEKSKFQISSCIYAIASIYGFAAFHKAYNFSVMPASMGRVLGDMLLPSFIQLCPPTQNYCGLIDFMAYSVILVEATIAIGLLFASTHFWAALLAFIFHLTLSTFTSLYVTPVGFLMLCLHGIVIIRILSLKTSELNLRDLKPLIWILGTILTFRLPLLFTNKLYQDLYDSFLNSLLFYSPFLLLMIAYYYRRKPTGLRLQNFFKMKMTPLYITFVAFILGFGITPVINDYAVPSVGWTMFSGGVEAQGYQFTSFHNTESCPIPEQIFPLMWTIRSQQSNKIAFYAKERDFQNILKAMKRHCPKAVMTSN